MIRYAVLALAAGALYAPEPPPDKPTDGKKLEAPGLPQTPDAKAPDPQTAGPDLSRQKLEFDPRAPGGARPLDQEGTEPVPVDPSTVTLFPVQPTTPTQPKEKKHD